MLAIVSFNQLSAQPKHAPTVTNIVLVHGAWADGSSWSRVIPLLEARHFHVIAVQLPLTSLVDDVATTKRAIARITTEQPGPVLLVGHSYGGVVIGEAGNDPNVVGLVYVAAFAPDQGESALSLLQGAQTPSPLGSHLVVDASGFFTIDQTGVEEDFAQCLPEGERRILAVTQGPTSGAALTGLPRHRRGGPNRRGSSSRTAIAASRPDLEQAMAAHIGAHSIALRTCHVAMLDLPFKVADVIADAAGEK
jgi:Predicted hydrolases or acyltransferases (alpha/beta hydrolase superfamily)